MLQYTGRPAAIARMTGEKEAPMLRGTVKFYQHPGGVVVEAEISGLPRQNGFYGFHIHEGTACTGANFADTRSHYNPTAAAHPFHAGDLPPLLGCSGRAYMVVLTDRFSIREILGRTVVIHSDADDFTSQPAGNAGTKIACGNIGRA